MMTQLLAEVTGGGNGLTLSVAAITATGVAVAAVIKAYRSGVQKGETSRTVTVRPPMPEVTTREAPKFAETGDLHAHETRTAEALKKMAEDIDQVHTRLNSAFRKLDTLDGSMDAVREITGKLLDIALGLPQGTTSARTRKPTRD